MKDTGITSSLALTGGGFKYGSVEGNAREKTRRWQSESDSDPFREQTSNELLSNSEEALKVARDLLPPEIGKQFDSHGIAKGKNVRNLLSLLDNGVDPNRPFHTMNLKIDKEDEMGAVTMGAAGPYDSGGFIVIGEPGKQIKDGGVKGVLVNAQYYEAIPELQRVYPNVRWIRADEMSEKLTAWTQEATEKKPIN